MVISGIFSILGPVTKFHFVPKFSLTSIMKCAICRTPMRFIILFSLLTATSCFRSGKPRSNSPLFVKGDVSRVAGFCKSSEFQLRWHRNRNKGDFLSSPMFSSATILPPPPKVSLVTKATTLLLKLWSGTVGALLGWFVSILKSITSYFQPKNASDSAPTDAKASAVISEPSTERLTSEVKIVTPLEIVEARKVAIKIIQGMDEQEKKKEQKSITSSDQLKLENSDASVATTSATAVPLDVDNLVISSAPVSENISSDISSQTNASDIEAATEIAVTASDAVSSKGGSILSAKSDLASMKDKIKAFGVSGTISYILTEVGFWMLSLPIIISGYHNEYDEWLNIFNSDDQAKILTLSAAFVTAARLAVPFRLALAVSLTPFVDRYIKPSSQPSNKTVA